MASTNLTVLLDLRRAAEDEAKCALAEAIANLARAKAEQARLKALVAQAEDSLAAEKRSHPTSAGEGLARERFRQRLLAQREQAKSKATQHREGPLRLARLAETAATESLRQISVERQAAERLCERQQAEERKQAGRRQEQRDDDWIQASRHHRKPG
jgi:flagellar export protein FliJ